ncbi:Mov34/MPN/PAD-1 family protein [Enterobacter cloacae complex sp. 379K3]|uniref:Mov34/MPN/PAD-1 family protein n=1 Tax=Enterobacter cloacae complex sp. 379K3 TaxID=3395865 RepID=UPI003CE8491C
MLSQRLISAIEKHAAAAYPHECCGLIIGATRQRRYIPCSNSHKNPSEHFMISAQAWA